MRGIALPTPAAVNWVGRAKVEVSGFRESESGEEP